MKLWKVSCIIVCLVMVAGLYAACGGGNLPTGADLLKLEMPEYPTIMLKHKVLRVWKESNDPNGMGAEILLKENLEETKPETIIAFLQGRGRKNNRNPVVVRVFTSEQAWQEEKDEAWGEAYDTGYLAYYKRVKDGDHFIRWMQKSGPYAPLHGKMVDFNKAPEPEVPGEEPKVEMPKEPELPAVLE